MSLLLAAVGAMAVALLELSVGQYLRIGGAQPHLVLVLGVIVTIAIGVEGGLAWAFVGGLVLDVLAQRPIGSTAFALLVAVAGAAVIARVLSRLRPLAPIPAVLLLSFVYSMTLFVLFGALRSPIADTAPLQTLLPGAVYDTIVAAIVGPLAIAVHDRHAEQERVDW